MPFSPAQTQQIALEMRRLYGDAEIAIIERITRAVAQDIDAPDWAQRKQQDIHRLRTAVEREIATLNSQGVTEMDRVVREAYRGGSQSAVVDLRKVISPDAINTSFNAANERAIRRFVQEGVTGIQSTHTRILRQADDVFRKVISDASGMGVTGVQTRRQVAQQALNQFANAGITGFRDSAGRNWDIASYTEMATRTTMTRAAIEGTTDRFRENGQDLVIVSALGESCPLCDPHEGQIYSLSGDSDKYPAFNSAIADGLFHPNCVVGETLVSGPRPLAVSSRWYEGEVVTIVTTSGPKLTITPNHPVLTPEGWVAAGLLNEGDQIVKYIGQQGVVQGTNPDNVDIPTPIKDVACSFRESSGMTATCMPVAAEDFHGDGSNGNVDIIATNRFLVDRFVSIFGKPSSEHTFSSAVGLRSLFSCFGTLGQLRLWSLDTANSSMSRCGECGTLLNSHAGKAATQSFGACRSGKNAALLESIMNSHLGNTEMVGDIAFGHSRFIETDRFVDVENKALASMTHIDPGAQFTELDSLFLGPSVDLPLATADDASDLLDRISGHVEVDNLISVKVNSFHGYVYNLETTDGWYASNSIITHNCRHDADLWVEGLSTKPERPPKETREDRYENMQEQRANERAIRQWKRREAAALSDDERAKAQAKVREWQARQREFVEETGQRRKYERESLRSAR